MTELKYLEYLYVYKIGKDLNVSEVPDYFDITVNTDCINDILNFVLKEELIEVLSWGKFHCKLRCKTGISDVLLNLLYVSGVFLRYDVTVNKQCEEMYLWFPMN